MNTNYKPKRLYQVLCRRGHTICVSPHKGRVSPHKGRLTYFVKANSSVSKKTLRFSRRVISIKLNVEDLL